MNASADKAKEVRPQAAASEGFQRQRGGDSCQFADNRPEAASQRKLQQMANNSPQARKSVQLLSIVTSNVSASSPPIQLMNGTYSNQPLITNFFGNPRTNQTFEESDLPYHFNPEEVEIEGDDNDFSASVPDLGELGQLELFEDNAGKKWINQIHVHERAKRRGIATLLLSRAINQHRTLYASTQAAEEDNGPDTRHLTDEGELLVNKCIERGMRIVKTYPFS